MSAGYRIVFIIPVIIAAPVFSLTLGRYPVSITDLFHFALTATGQDMMEKERYDLIKTVLLDIRLPRVIASLLIGASLSVSGGAFQAIFMNPLVSPGLLGVLSGAAFGAAMAMLFSAHWVTIQITSFLFGLIAVIFTLSIAGIHRSNTVLMLVLGGIISGSLFASLLSVVKYVADPYNQLPAITYWLMGSLSSVDLKTALILSVPITIGIASLVALSRYMNVLSMGDEEAKSLGVNVKLIRLAIIFFATLISALTVVMSGMIGWIGLIVPHVTRLIVGPNNERVIPMCALVGALFLLLVDNISRLAFTVEIPLGIISELIGIPIFILVLRNIKSGWGD